MKEEALELADFLEKNMVASVAILGDVTATHIVSTIRRLAEELDKQEYRNKHEGFSTIQEVIAKHEAIPSRKEAIDKAREWLKNLPIEKLIIQTKPLSEETIEELREYHGINDWLYETSIVDFVRAVEKAHGIK